MIFPDGLQPVLLDGDILHYRCSTPEEYRQVERRHAALHSLRLSREMSSISPLTPFMKAAGAFLGCYLSKGAILDGPEGRAISREQYRSTFMAYNLARRALKKAQ